MCAAGCVIPGLAPAVRESLFLKTMRSAERVTDQVPLKFIVSHPALTCAIPATGKVAHVIENMGAAAGALPDASLRRRMAAYVESL